MCRVAVWSHYAGAGDAVCFVRVGTLDEPDRLPPDIHIFTASKQPWVVLPPGVPAVAEYYADVRALARGEPRAPRGAARGAGPHVAGVCATRDGGGVRCLAATGGVSLKPGGCAPSTCQ